MNIEIKSGLVRLARYAGGETVDGRRRSHRVRVGQFPENALPEFATSANDSDSERIPWSIYRNTTPVEHECILEFMRVHHRSKAVSQLEEVARTLERIASLNGLEIPEALTRRLQSASRRISRFASPSSTDARMADRCREKYVNGGEKPIPTLDASVSDAAMHNCYAHDGQRNSTAIADSPVRNAVAGSTDAYQS